MVRPILDAFRGGQFKPTLILASSALLMVTWWEFGSPRFYLDHLAPISSGIPRGDAAAAVYQFAACLFLLGLIPAAIVKLVFREPLRDYGVGLGNRLYTFRSFAVSVPVWILLGYSAAVSPAYRTYYPINPQAAASAGGFAFHAATYLMFYLGWEFHFRGYLQLGLRGSLGAANALLVQTMASGLLHFGRPASEVFASLGAGVLWGLIVYRTNSLLAVVLMHYLLGLSLDYFICFH